MAVSYPLAALLVVLSLLSLPGKESFQPSRKTVGFQGPLALLPEVDIIPEEPSESRLTAAPRTSAPADFQVIEIDYAVKLNALPQPEPTPAAEKERGEPRDEPVIPDEQQAARTTGHPVLAATEYVLLYFERPIYPNEAVQLGIQGLVEVIILVDTHGQVIRTHVVNPDRVPILERAAEIAVKKSIFRPHIQNGKPTPFWVKVPFEFRLVGPR
jgi:protein TonB